MGRIVTDWDETEDGASDSAGLPDDGAPARAPLATPSLTVEYVPDHITHLLLGA